MRYFDRERCREEPAVSDIAAAEAGHLIHQAKPVSRGLRHRWWGAVVIGALALVLSGLWRSGPTAMPSGAPAPEWAIGLTSSGAAPVSALVFGKEAGIHLVRIPGSSAPPEEQRRVLARLASGEVYMVSLGGRELRVSSKGPPGSGVIAMAATGRFVKLYQRPGITGISTGWW